MKKIIAQTALTACVLVTIMMAISVVSGYLFVGPSEGLNISASIYLGSIAGAVLQALWFSGAALKKPSYLPRFIGFNACFLPVLALCAWIGNWFPVDDLGFWIGFLVLYAILLAVFTAAYGIYFKKAAGGYDEALARYHHDRRDR